jgi:hypothetical protein
MDDFNRCAWAEVIEAAADKECAHYAEDFRKKIEDTTDGISKAIYETFYHVCSFRFVPSDSNEPFKPMMTMSDGRRSAIPEDFDDDMLNSLRLLGASVDDAELRARLSDLLWVRKRDHKLAVIALEAYLESASLLESRSSLFSSFERIERALRLAKMLNKQEVIQKIKSLIEEFLDRRSEQEPLQCAGLIRLLKEFRIGEPTIEAGRAKKIAEKADARRDFDSAFKYWSFSADWLLIAKDQTGEHAARVAGAETYVKQIELLEARDSPNYMLIVYWLEKAIEAYRRIGRLPERVSELQKRLLAMQSRAVSQLAALSSGPVDVKELVEKAVSVVSGKRFTMQ